MIVQDILLFKRPKIKIFLLVIVLGQKTSVCFMGDFKMLVSNKMKVTTVDPPSPAWRHLLVRFSWGSCCQAVPKPSLVCFEMFLV